jgi:hypothetical protein
MFKKERKINTDIFARSQQAVSATSIKKLVSTVVEAFLNFFWTVMVFERK